MKTNPFTELRLAALNPDTREPLSQQDYALAMGVAPATISAVERGLIEDPRALLDALAARNHDVDAIRRRYDEWRAEQSRSLQETVQAVR